jgi:hypothetical protein
MNAEHVEDLVDLEALGALTAEESEFVRAHASECPLCRADLAQAEAVVARLALAVPLHRAPAGLRSRVLAEVTAPIVRLAEPAPVPQPRPPTPIMRFNRRWGSIAAALFLVPLVGLLAWALVLQNQVNDLKEQSQQIQETQRDVVLLAASPPVRGRFVPTESAGEATGTVTWNPEEGRCAVSVLGLHKESGTDYHVYYKSPRGDIDAGELKPDDEGTATLVFDVSKWKGDTYTVWVSAIRGNGEQTPLLHAWLRRE